MKSIPKEALEALSNFENTFNKALNVLSGNDLKTANEVKRMVANLDEEGLKRLQTQIQNDTGN